MTYEKQNKRGEPEKQFSMRYMSRDKNTFTTSPVPPASLVRRVQASILQLYTERIKIVIFLLLCAVLVAPAFADSFTIDGDRVYVDDNKAFIEFRPHTAADEWVYGTILSKQYTGDLNFMWLFDTQQAQPRKLEVCNPSFTVCQAAAEDIEKRSISFGDKDTAYIIKDRSVNANTQYNIRFYLDTALNASGKYDFIVFPSSYGYDVIDAYTSGHAYYLDPWFNNTFLNRFNITIDHTKIDSTVVDFPVYFNMSNSPGGFWSDVQTDGGDIRITDINDSEIPFEIVWLNTTAQTGELYFKGTLDPNIDSKFWVYYNYSGTLAHQYAPDDTYGSQNVWTNYAGVFHFYNVSDSTATGSVMSFAGGATSTAGWIGPAAYCDGSNDYLEVDGDPFDSLSSTMMLLLRTTDASANTGILARFFDSTPPLVFRFYLNNGDWNGFPYDVSSNNGPALTSTTNINTGYWKMISVGITDATNERLYYDDTEVDNNAWAAGGLNTNSNDPLQICKGNPYETGYTNTDVDELRIANTDFSEDYIQATYRNLFSSSSFYTVGTQQAQNVSSSFVPFSATAKDNDTNLTINSFVLSATLQGSGLPYWTYSTSNGTVITNISNTNSSDWQFIFNSTGYYTRTYNTQNVTSNFTALLFPETTATTTTTTTNAPEMTVFIILCVLLVLLGYLGLRTGAVLWSAAAAVIGFIILWQIMIDAFTVLIPFKVVIIVVDLIVISLLFALMMEGD